MTLLLTVVSIWFAQASRVANSRYFSALVLILTTGVNGALLTGDLFNLFVFLEVMLLPSYGLYVLSANRNMPVRRIHGMRLYVTLNLFTSTLYMIGALPLRNRRSGKHRSPGRSSEGRHCCSHRGRGMYLRTQHQSLSRTHPRLACTRLPGNITSGDCTVFWSPYESRHLRHLPDLRGALRR